MATKHTESLQTASVLAFERKLDSSDAIFSAGNWVDRRHHEAWLPIEVHEKSVRGTISNRLKVSKGKASSKDDKTTEKVSDSAKLDADITKPNLQRVDLAALAPTTDTLKVSFTLRVLGGAGTPSACNSADYQRKLLDTVKNYTDTAGFTELAQRYAGNLANARFLWRNRLGAEQIEVHVAQWVDGKAAQSWTFDALALSLRQFEASADVKALGELLAQGLAGSRHVLLQVTAFARLGAGQEVFPSQELILDKGSSTVGAKSKTLYTVNQIAAMHSQKIGNALRTIDTWYPLNESTDQADPIAVEPYGSVTSQGKAYRKPIDKVDFYSLLDAWVLKGIVPELEQQHYVMANLIRGGVFGKAEEKSKE